MLQSAINGKSTFTSAGSSVSAVIDKDSGVLKLTSTRYGSASNVNIVSDSGTPVADLLGAVPNANRTEGVDVAGTIGGQPASGSGQYLTGGEGTPVDGLKLQITGATGDRGTIDFARGYAFLLNNLIDSFTASKGLIASRKDGINASIKEIDEQRDKLNTRLAATEKRYRAQFTALDVTMSNMTKTSSYLTQQLASLASLSSQ
jgi:flagellar hook-associated protein 2